MKKLIVVFTILLSSVFLTNAQDYATGIGIRGGLSSGLTIKHFISNNTAIEALVSMRWRGYNITGLYEIHGGALGITSLNWYYGFGGHVGFWDGYDKHPWFEDNKSYTVIGIDGIAGLEYNFSSIPFNISIDWKPAFNVVGHTGFWGDELALSIRYTF